MIGELLMHTVPFFAAGGGGALGWYFRNACGKVHDPKPSPKPPADKSEADLIKQGYEAIDKMARDIHGLYHPPGCKCVFCELKADDQPAEPPPGERCVNPCFGCSVLTCDKHPDHGAAPNFVVMVDGEPVAARVSVEEPERISPEYVKALKDKINGLRQENAELRKGKGEKIVTKVEERKTKLQNEIDQVMSLVDKEGQPIVLDTEYVGRPIQVTVGPQREPDSELEMWGEPETIKRWHDKAPKVTGPQSGPGSLGFMDRQLGTIGRICDRCREGKAWKYHGSQMLCKQCFYTMPTNDVTSIRQEGGRKYVCYRDGHCEVT